MLTSEEATQLRILRAGMTISLDPKGEKNRGMSIAFPIRKQPEPNYQRRGNGNGSNGNGSPNSYSGGNVNANPDNRPKKESLLLQSD